MKIAKHVGAVIGAVLLIAAGLATAGVRVAGGVNEVDEHQVLICHHVEGNGSTGNGFNLIVVDKDSIAGLPNGHDTHELDLIPPFPAGAVMGPPGPNKTWDAYPGKGDYSLIATNCAATETTTTTTTETTTTTTPPPPPPPPPPTTTETTTTTTTTPPPPPPPTETTTTTTTTPPPPPNDSTTISTETTATETTETTETTTTPPAKPKPKPKPQAKPKPKPPVKKKMPPVCPPGQVQVKPCAVQGSG